MDVILHKEIREIAVDDLILPALNANVVPEETMKSIIHGIQTEGFITPVVVQKSTNLVIDGSHRVQAAKHLGMYTILAQFVECDDKTAARLALAINNRQRGGKNDAAIVQQMLQDIANDCEDVTAELADGSLALEIGLAQEQLTAMLKGTSFLDDLTDGDEDEEKGEDKEKDRPTQDVTKLEFVVTMEDKYTILDAISKAKAYLGTPLGGEALAHICNEFMGATK